MDTSNLKTQGETTVIQQDEVPRLDDPVSAEPLREFVAVQELPTVEEARRSESGRNPSNNGVEVVANEHQGEPQKTDAQRLEEKKEAQANEPVLSEEKIVPEVEKLEASEATSTLENKDVPSKEVEITEEKPDSKPQATNEAQPNNTLTLQQQLALAVSLKEKAKHFISSKEWDQALKLYDEAAIIIDTMSNQFTPSTSPHFINDCIVNYNFLNNNICFCYQKMGNHVEAIKSAEKVISNDPGNHKALYRMASSYLELQDLKKAYFFIKSARHSCLEQGIQEKSVKDLYISVKKMYEEKFPRVTKEKSTEESRLNNSTLNTSNLTGNGPILDPNDLSTIANNADFNEKKKILECDKEQEIDLEKTKEFDFRYYSLLSISSLLMGSLVTSTILRKEVKTPFGAISALVLSGNFMGCLASRSMSTKLMFFILGALYSGFLVKKAIKN